VTPADVIEYVKNDYISDFKSFMGSMSEDQIRLFLGEDVVRKVAKSTVAGGMPNKTVPKSVNANRPAREPQKKTLSPREYFRR
jgi:hypothetical protein